MTDLSIGAITIEVETALVDGVPAQADIRHAVRDRRHSITVVAPAGAAPLAVGLRLRVTGMSRYFRNGYHSWDGSWWALPGTPANDGPPGRQPTLGFAATGFADANGRVAMAGFDRHDRFQTRFRFAGTPEAMIVDAETLLDGTGASEGETLHLFEATDGAAGLAAWAHRVAAASPLPPRVPEKRITGWCSWYNHYAMIDAPTIAAEIASCAAFRDAHGVPLDIFLIDDGFTPEMGDWDRFRPQFPDGVVPLVAQARAAGFVPGLWIAPFLVGNRSQLFADRPDWLIRDRATGAPHVAFHFYGEFRWHKRSEEYHLLDVTHPDAAAWIAGVLRQWREWGVGYFKTDFMYYPMEHGPERLVHHRPGLSRVAMWRMMAALIRDAIGPEAIWSGCGAPLWASVGYVDAIRIGRDIGVAMTGEYSAESLLRDTATRAAAHGILWQADPDCILLRDRFHDLGDDEVERLARHAAGLGGVLMTSDTLSALSPQRAALFAALLAQARPA